MSDWRWPSIGLAAGLLVGLWFASPWTAFAPPGTGWNVLRGFPPGCLVATGGLWAASAVAFAARTFPGSRGVLVRYLLLWGLLGLALAAPIIAAAVFLDPFPEVPPAFRAEAAVFLTLVCVLKMASFGVMRGIWAGEADERRRHEALRRRLAEAAPPPLDDARRALLQSRDGFSDGPG